MVLSGVKSCSPKHKKFKFRNAKEFFFCCSQRSEWSTWSIGRGKGGGWGRITGKSVSSAYYMRGTIGIKKKKKNGSCYGKRNGTK